MGVLLRSAGLGKIEKLISKGDVYLAPKSKILLFMSCGSQAPEVYAFDHPARYLFHGKNPITSQGKSTRILHKLLHRYSRLVCTKSLGAFKQNFGYTEFDHVHLKLFICWEYFENF